MCLVFVFSYSPTSIRDGSLILMSFIFSDGSYIQSHQQDFSGAVYWSLTRSLKNGTQLTCGVGPGDDQDGRWSPVLHLRKDGL